MHKPPYHLFCKRQREDEEEDDDEIDELLGNDFLYKRRKITNDANELESRRDRTPKSVFRHPMMIRNDDGSTSEMKPKDSLWQILYISNPPQSRRQKKIFRNRFRIPYDMFLDIVEQISQEDEFSQWTRKDACGIQASPLPLLLLGFFRFSGRCFTLDDLEELTAIGKETHRQFIHKFINFCSTKLWNNHVRIPTNTAEILHCESLFRMAGFPGCIGSTDGTHVPMQSCSEWTSTKHTGFKLNKPSRNYNVTANHCKQVLFSTKGKLHMIYVYYVFVRYT